MAPVTERRLHAVSGTVRSAGVGLRAPTQQYPRRPAYAQPYPADWLSTSGLSERGIRLSIRRSRRQTGSMGGLSSLLGSVVWRRSRAFRGAVCRLPAGGISERGGRLGIRCPRCDGLDGRSGLAARPIVWRTIDSATMRL